jgi:hypothetical protein
VRRRSRSCGLPGGGPRGCGTPSSSRRRANANLPCTRSKVVIGASATGKSPGADAWPPRSATPARGWAALRHSPGLPRGALRYPSGSAPAAGAPSSRPPPPGQPRQGKSTRVQQIDPDRVPAEHRQSFPRGQTRRLCQQHSHAATLRAPNPHQNESEVRQDKAPPRPDQKSGRRTSIPLIAQGNLVAEDAGFEPARVLTQHDFKSAMRRTHGFTESARPGMPGVADHSRTSTNGDE